MAQRWEEGVGAHPIYVQVTMHTQHPSPFPASYVHCHTPLQPHKLLMGATTLVLPPLYTTNWLKRRSGGHSTRGIPSSQQLPMQRPCPHPPPSLAAVLRGNVVGLSSESFPFLQARVKSAQAGWWTCPFPCNRRTPQQSLATECSDVIC